MTHGSVAKSDIQQLLFMVIIGLGVTFAFGLSWLGLTTACLIACLLCMAILASIRFGECRKIRDGASLEIFADQIYLFGYLLTMAAIAGVVLQTGPNGGNLLRTGGVKLITTIVGIFVMFSFKECAHRWEQDAKRLQGEQDSVLNHQLREAIRGLNEEAECMRQKFGRIVSTFDDASLQKLAGTANEMARIVQDTTQVFPALKTVAETTATSFGTLDGKIRETNNRLEKLTEDFSRAHENGAKQLAENLSHLAESAQKGDQGLAAAAESGKALEQILSRLAERAEADKERISQLRETFRRLTDSYEKLDQRVQGLLNFEGGGAPLVQQCLTQLHSSEQKLNVLNERLSLLSTKLDGADSRADADRNVLVQVGEALSKFSASFQQVSLLNERLSTLSTKLDGVGTGAEQDRKSLAHLSEAFSRTSESFQKLDQRLHDIIKQNSSQKISEISQTLESINTKLNAAVSSAETDTKTGKNWFSKTFGRP